MRHTLTFTTGGRGSKDLNQINLSYLTNLTLALRLSVDADLHTLSYLSDDSCECLSTTSYSVTLLAPELRPRALIILVVHICPHILSFPTDEHCLKPIFNWHTNRNVVAELKLKQN